MYLTTMHKLLLITVLLHCLPIPSCQEAQDRITILQREVVTLRTEKDTTSTGSADLEKELQELKDRNTTLEHQLLEYAETINDQSKYMRSQGASRGSGGMMADQDLIHISAFAKKQQLEHAEALAELQTKISSTSNTISNVQYTSMGISAEIEEYRVQNEIFVQELARKDEEIRVLRLGRGGSQNRLEEFENVPPLKQEIEHLREQTAQQEEEIRRLTADNQHLCSPSDKTGSPTSDYHPHAYNHFRPEDPQTSQLEADLASLNMEPSKAHRKRTAPGGRAMQLSSFEVVDVKTNEGTKVMGIGRPRECLNAKKKPRVVIKREEFEQGTLMFVGEVNGKELAGIQMDCRVSRPSGSGASISGDNDGTYKNGKKYFKSPMGYALYVPVSKVFVEMESAYV